MRDSTVFERLQSLNEWAHLIYRRKFSSRLNYIATEMLLMAGGVPTKLRNFTVSRPILLSQFVVQKSRKCKSIHFLKAPYNNSEINILWLWLIFSTRNYFFVTHATKWVLTWNECFLVSWSRRDRNFLQLIFRSLEFNSVDRFLIMTWFTSYLQLNMTYELSWFNKSDIGQKWHKTKDKISATPTER